ncbi:olfactory receptor 4B13-like [Latimeria chalumnae]|uniref:olfactory receptor 4B13-like n=1 Tax=Latimeria chalumnae TaxID=7897 RepID=UPI00313AE6E8
MDWKNKQADIIGIAIPNNENVSRAWSEKVRKYQDLAIDLKHVYRLDKVQLMPIIISVNGLVLKAIHENLKYLKLSKRLISQCQKAAILAMTLIVLEKSLHEPMYIFVGNLALNGLYGSTAFFPKLIVDLLSEKQTISYVGCLTQVFFLHSFACSEICILTVMAYDRYVAICNPLRYADKMNNQTIYKLITAAWGLPICFLSIDTFMSMEPVIIPPLANPVIYGLRTKEIKLKLKKRFSRSTKVSSFGR